MKSRLISTLLLGFAMVIVRGPLFAQSIPPQPTTLVQPIGPILIPNMAQPVHGVTVPSISAPVMVFTPFPLPILTTQPLPAVLPTNPVTHLSTGQIVVSPAGSILIQNLPGFVPGALTSPPVTSLPTVNLSVLGAGR